MGNLRTAESVTEGHPDKVADQISDAVLDEALRQDPGARVAVETLISKHEVVLAGEVTTTADINYLKVVIETLQSIGYSPVAFNVQTHIQEQSPEIAQKAQAGAGDQGTVVGYATDETLELMPAPILYANRLTDRLTLARKSGVKWLRPDGKAQVTLEYQDEYPVRVDSVVLSAQHDGSGVDPDMLKRLIESVLPMQWLDKRTQYYLNGFELGGPDADTGLTGRKNIVDSYGPTVPQGGGSFSGKDPSKLDRSGAYMARLIAKRFVASGAFSSCEVQLSYAIGVPLPVAITCSRLADPTLITKVYDLSTEGIIKVLDLRRPIYRATAVGGHFGRKEFTWEQ